MSYWMGELYFEKSLDFLISIKKVKDAIKCHFILAILIMAYHLFPSTIY